MPLQLGFFYKKSKFDLEVNHDIRKLFKETGRMSIFQVVLLRMKNTNSYVLCVNNHLKAMPDFED